MLRTITTRMIFLSVVWLISARGFAGNDISDTSRIVALDEKRLVFVVLTEWSSLMTDDKLSQKVPMFLHAYSPQGGVSFFIDLGLSGGKARGDFGSKDYLKNANSELNHQLQNLKKAGYKVEEPKALSATNNFPWNGWTMRFSENALPRKKWHEQEFQMSLVGTKKSSTPQPILAEAKRFSATNRGSSLPTGIYSLFENKVLIGLYGNAPQEPWVQGQDYWVLRVDELPNK